MVQSGRLPSWKRVDAPPPMVVLLCNQGLDLLKGTPFDNAASPDDWLPSPSIITSEKAMEELGWILCHWEILSWKRKEKSREDSERIGRKLIASSIFSKYLQCKQVFTEKVSKVRLHFLLWWKGNDAETWCQKDVLAVGPEGSTMPCVHYRSRSAQSHFRQGHLIHHTSRTHQWKTVSPCWNTHKTHIFKYTGHVYKIRLLKATSEPLESVEWRTLNCFSSSLWYCRHHLKSGYIFELKMFLQIFSFQLSTWISFSNCFLLFPWYAFFLFFVSQFFFCHFIFLTEE